MIIKNTEKRQYTSLLVEADVFNEFGKQVHIPGVISADQCQRLAKRNHKTCEGRGILNFDDGRVFYDADGKRQVLSKWKRTCNCVSKKLENKPSLIG